MAEEISTGLCWSSKNRQLLFIDIGKLISQQLRTTYYVSIHTHRLKNKQKRSVYKENDVHAWQIPIFEYYRKT